MAMDPVRIPTPPIVDSGPIPKSPIYNTTTSPRRNSTEEREKSATPTNERTPSPEPNCAICLGKLQNKSFTDSCLHQFCFTCLLEWSKVKAECPLCKQNFKSIIHNVRSNEDYDQYHLRPAENPWINLINIDVMSTRFRYRSTLTPNRRLERALEHLEQDLHRRVDPGDIIPPQRTWRRRRGLASDDFRVRVYTQDLWVSLVPTFDTAREMTPQDFRNHPETVHRLIPWLNRELQAILRIPSLSARVLDVVITQLPRHHIQSAEFRVALENYFRDQYDHFIHEFYTFACSPYDMIGFDEHANYSVCRPNVWVDVAFEALSDSSDSSCVILLGDNQVSSSVTNRANNNSSVTSRPDTPMPGPSRIRPIDEASDSEENNISSDHSIVLSPSHENDVILYNENLNPQPSHSEVNYDSDSCVIVGYVKPRHERTPEIITLDSSDHEAEEDVMEVVQNTPYYKSSQYDMEYFNRSYQGYGYSSTTSSDNSSDSEYVPGTSSKSRKKKKKKVQHKNKCSTKSNSKARISHNCESSSIKKRGHVRIKYTSSDSDSSICCRRDRSSSECSISSFCSSNNDPDYESHSWRKNKSSPQRDKKYSWRIRLNVPGMKSENDYPEPPYTSSEINNFLSGSSSSNSRPKLRSIVITRKSNDDRKSRESSMSSSRERDKSYRGKQYEGSCSRSKSHKENISRRSKDVASSSTSVNNHRGSSHSSSHSSHRHSSKARDKTKYKHSKKDIKKRIKKRRDSRSSSEIKVRSSKSKKRKKNVNQYFDSSDD